MEHELVVEVDPQLLVERQVLAAVVEVEQVEAQPAHPQLEQAQTTQGAGPVGKTQCREAEGRMADLAL